MGNRFAALRFYAPPALYNRGVNADDTYKARLVNEINALKRRNAELEKRKGELLAQGVSSNALSSGGGSRSANYLDIGKYNEEIARNGTRIEALTRRLVGRSALRIAHLQIRRA